MSTAVNTGIRRGNRVSQHLKLIWDYFRFNLAAAMEYRGSFFLQVFGMALNNSAFILFWSILFTRVKTIGNYGFREIMIIWALSSATFGFVHVVFGNIRQLTRIVIQGDLDTYLLQPKDVCINLLASRSVVSAWGDLMYGWILFIAVFGWDPAKLTLFGCFTFWGGLLMGSVFFFFQSLTFFIGDATAIGRMVTEFMISFSIYPESIYQGAVRWLIYSLFPAGFIVFVPLQIMRYFSWPKLGMLVLIDILYMAISYWFFRWGLRKYESGNLVGARV